MTMFPLRAVSGCSSLIGALYAGFTINKKVQQAYPANIENYSQQKFYYDNGQKYFIIGYFGASEDIIKNKLDFKNRDLYTTPNLAVAQNYAAASTKKPDKPATALIVSPVRSLQMSDQGSQRFEGPHFPIRPDALQALKATVIRIDPVNKETRLGFFASMKRAYNIWKNSRG